MPESFSVFRFRNETKKTVKLALLDGGNADLKLGLLTAGTKEESVAILEEAIAEGRARKGPSVVIKSRARIEVPVKYKDIFVTAGFCHKPDVYERFWNLHHLSWEPNKWVCLPDELLGKRENSWWTDMSITGADRLGHGGYSLERRRHRHQEVEEGEDDQWCKARGVSRESTCVSVSRENTGISREGTGTSEATTATCSTAVSVATTSTSASAASGRTYLAPSTPGSSTPLTPTLSPALLRAASLGASAAVSPAAPSDFPAGPLGKVKGMAQRFEAASKAAAQQAQFSGRKTAPAAAAAYSTLMSPRQEDLPPLRDHITSSDFKPGQNVHVYSSSASQWFMGSVVKVKDGKVLVRFGAFRKEIPEDRLQELLRPMAL